MVAQLDKIRTIDGFVGIIDELVRTMDLLLENKKIAQKKLPNWAGPNQRPYGRDMHNVYVII